MSNLTSSSIAKKVIAQTSPTIVNEVITQTNQRLRPMISLGFDDGYSSDQSIVHPMLQKNGMRGTFFIPKEINRNDPKWLSLAQIKALSDNGHEVGCHTVTQPRLTTLSDDEILSEWRESKMFLEEVTGKPVLSHAYPYGDADERVTHLAGGIFEAARGTTSYTKKVPFPVPQEGLKSVMLYGQGDIHNVPGVGLDSASIAGSENFINDFLSLPEPTFLNLYFHRVYRDDDPKRPSNRRTESSLKALVEHISDLKRQGLVDVVTFSEGVRRIQTAQSIYL